jgi:prepilin-type processing-associated H-X9-DG protein
MYGTPMASNPKFRHGGQKTIIYEGSSSVSNLSRGTVAFVDGSVVRLRNEAQREGRARQPRGIRGVGPATRAPEE